MEDSLSREKQVLAQRYIPYATTIARKFSRRRKQFGVEWDELHAAAMLGLVDAAQRFEPDQGVAFEAYSRARILGAIIDHLRRGGWHHAGYLKYLWEREEQESAAEGISTEPGGERQLLRALLGARSAADFANAANAIDSLPFRFIVTSLENGHETVEPYSLSVGCPEAETISENLRQYFLQLFERLVEDEKSVLRLHYFEGLSYEQMRFHFQGSSKATLSRLHRRALQHLRAAMEREQRLCSRRIAEARARAGRV